MGEDDFWDTDPTAVATAVAWAKHVLDDMAPKMRGSAIVAQIVPPDEGDMKFWVELGASIMMGKPIIAVVLGDRPLPGKLASVADEVVRLPDGVSVAGSTKLAEAIHRVIGE